MPLTVAATFRATPSPRETEQCKDVDDIQAAVKQSVRPNRMLDVGVASWLPRLSPLIVTPQPAVEAVLSVLK